MEPDLTENAVKVLERRYLLRNSDGEIVETPSEMFRRVAQTVAGINLNSGKDEAATAELEETFFNMMSNLDFLPNSPTLMNAGTGIGQLSACFVLPVEDSIPGIFDAVRNMALIHKSGGGTGFSFSRLRPKGDVVQSTEGLASGPLSFMRVFDVSTDVIKQGGKRRGANMGILNVDHPDIIEFITAKTHEDVLTNFNISVAATEQFMRAVEEDSVFELINPRTKKAVRKLKAREIWNLLVAMAWKTGDPGVIFTDEINHYNPTPQLGVLEATNPCGEQPLLAYESCNLGSINLSKIVEAGKVNWTKLGETVRNAVHFLDNVIDANRYPLPKIESVTKGNRKIGLGVMGFADMLVQLGVPYNSEEATAIADTLMRFIKEEGRRKSVELGNERGAFPNFEGSIWDKRRYEAMRNATITTIAPTGSISIIAGCSSGIEPLFAVAFIRNVMDGTQLLEVNPHFERTMKENGLYSENLMREIAKQGSIQKVERLPKSLKRVFVTSLDIAPEWHVKMQAAFQKHTDNAVSKTVNLSSTATIKDVETIFLLAHKLKCKGITVYRYGSKREQVLYVGAFEKGAPKIVRADSEYAGGCPTPYCPWT